MSGRKTSVKDQIGAVIILFFLMLYIGSVVLLIFTEQEFTFSWRYLIGCLFLGWIGLDVMLSIGSNKNK